MQGGKPPALEKRGGGANGYIRSFEPVVFGRSFLIALLAYIDREKQEKINKPYLVILAD